jgi:acyl carrier protein
MERRIAAILIEELKLEDVTPDSFDVQVDLIQDLGLDSMDMTTVVLMLQDEYNITIDEDDYPKLRTVRAMAEHFRELGATG